MAKTYGDENGIFWNTGTPDPKALTLLPESDWRPPAELPDRLYGLIGFDLETCDEGLRAKQGPGWAWAGGGFVAGYAICADNFKGYLPIAHQGGGNMDPARVRSWLNHVLADPTQPKVGANTMYDLGWAQTDGVQVAGPIYDIQWAEALLDEHRFTYGLDVLAKDYLGRTKDETILRQAAAVYGIDPKADLWRLPPQYVGPYAEEDAALAREVWIAQVPELKKQELWDLCELEHELLPLYVDMRRAGVPIDMDAAAQLKAELATMVKDIEAEIHRRTGIAVDVWAPTTIARAFDKENLYYGRTAKTSAPSITKELLETTDHWLAQLVLQARECSKLGGTFVDGYLLNQTHGGRIHGEIHPLKSDRAGATSGRISMSSPNLQNIPVRTELGNKIRRAFIAEVGELWASPDFSQQEPRLLVHLASLVRIRGKPLAGVDEAIAFYTKPDGDIYQLLQEAAGLDRKKSKTLTLARIYGRGVTSTAKQLGVSHDEATEYFRRFDEGLPLAAQMMDVCQRQVNRNGYIKSILGRRNRFPFWEPASWHDRDGRMFMRERAEQEWPGKRLVRARAHKALNSAIQPSAADQTKLAMRDIKRAGYGKYLRIQVHDELACSVPEPRVAEDIAEIMRNAVKLAVPVKVGVTCGANWGECK